MRAKKCRAGSNPEYQNSSREEVKGKKTTCATLQWPSSVVIYEYKKMLSFMLPWLFGYSLYEYISSVQCRAPRKSTREGSEGLQQPTYLKRTEICFPADLSPSCSQPLAGGAFSEAGDGAGMSRDAAMAHVTSQLSRAQPVHLLSSTCTVSCHFKLQK